MDSESLMVALFVVGPVAVVIQYQVIKVAVSVGIRHAITALAKRGSLERLSQLESLVTLTEYVVARQRDAPDD